MGVGPLLAARSAVVRIAADAACPSRPFAVHTAGDDRGAASPLAVPDRVPCLVAHPVTLLVSPPPDGGTTLLSRLLNIASRLGMHTFLGEATAQAGPRARTPLSAGCYI